MTELNPNAELLSILLILQPLEPFDTLRDRKSKPDPGEHTNRSWGRAAHSFLLRLIEQMDAKLAQELHDEQGIKPFTCSSLLGKFSSEQQALPDKEYRLRLTTYDARLSAVLRQALRTDNMLTLGSTRELDYQPFVIKDIYTDAQQSPWCALESYQSLASSGLLAESKPPRRLRLQFSSPTAFKSAHRTQPLPLPDLVFGHLLGKWNQFAPLAMPDEVKRFAGECLAVSQFNLRSRLVQTKQKGKRSGAVGMVTYSTLNYDRYWMSLLHTLARFSFFSGLGFGTTQGMGQCRLLPQEDRKKI